MKTKYQSKYTTISIDSIKKYIEIRRTILTEDQSDQEYKNEILKWVQVIEAEKPVYQLVDGRNMRYLIMPELQVWVNETLIQPSIQVGLRRVAFITSKDIFATTSLKQMVNRIKNPLIKVGYFENEEEARTWLFLPETENNGNS